MLEVPDTVRSKAHVAGADHWLEGLADLIAELELDWSLTVGRPFADATEAYVAEADLHDGTPAVIKLLIPRDGNDARHEITALRLAGGDGLAQLLRSDDARHALLIERLGRSLDECRLSIERRHHILCDAAARVWRPASGRGLPTGAMKGRWLVDFVADRWERLDRPCSERTVAGAIVAAEHRIAAHDDERAVLVHGDVHRWNALESRSGFTLVDPDGLLAEAEYDLGVIMREDPVELLADPDPRDRARWLAVRTGRDPTAVWEWGVIERLATGLTLTEIDLQPVGRQMLATADAVAGLDSPA